MQVGALLPVGSASAWHPSVGSHGTRRRAARWIGTCAAGRHTVNEILKHASYPFVTTAVLGRCSQSLETKKDTQSPVAAPPIT